MPFDQTPAQQYPGLDGDSVEALLKLRGAYDGLVKTAEAIDELTEEYGNIGGDRLAIALDALFFTNPVSRYQAYGFQSLEHCILEEAGIEY